MDMATGTLSIHAKSGRLTEVKSFIVIMASLVTSIAQAELYDWSPDASHHAAVVRVTTPSGSAGSGVYVTQGDLPFVLTAAHVTEGSTSASVTFLGGQTGRGTCTADRSGADISAILTGPIDGVTPVAIAQSDPQDGLEICGFGGPLRGFRHFLCRLTDRGQQIITGNGKVTYGDSGGPWFVEGELVGIQSTGANPSTQVQSFDIFTTCHSAQTHLIRDFAKRLHERFCQQGGS